MSSIAWLLLLLGLVVLTVVVLLFIYYKLPDYLVPFAGRPDEDFLYVVRERTRKRDKIFWCYKLSALVFAAPYIFCLFYVVLKSLAWNSCTYPPVRWAWDHSNPAGCEVGLPLLRNKDDHHTSLKDNHAGDREVDDLQYEFLGMPAELDRDRIMLLAHERFARNSAQFHVLADHLSPLAKVLKTYQAELEDFVDKYCIVMDDIVAFHSTFEEHFARYTMMRQQPEINWLTWGLLALNETVGDVNFYAHYQSLPIPDGSPRTSWVYNELIYQSSRFVSQSNQKLDGLYRGLKAMAETYKSIVEPAFKRITDFPSESSTLVDNYRKDLERSRPRYREIWLEFGGTLAELKYWRKHRDWDINVQELLRKTQTSLRRTFSYNERLHGKVKTLSESFALLSKEQLKQGADDPSLKAAGEKLKEYGALIGAGNKGLEEERKTTWTKKKEGLQSRLKVAEGIKKKEEDNEKIQEIWTTMHGEL